jgi:hypothetical protein
VTTPTEAFNAALGGRTRLINGTLAELRALLQKADADILAVLAALPSDYQAWYLPQLQGEVRRVLELIAGDVAAAVDAGQVAAWRQGSAMVDGVLAASAVSVVLGARLLAVFHALQIERTAHDVVTHTRQVLDTTATNQHHAVFLQVVSFAADVGDDLKSVGQAHFGNLAQRGVGLFWRRGVDAGADAAALRRILHRRAFGLGLFDLAPLTHQLIDGWH